MAEKHIVKNWKGSRISYNFLKQQGHLDPWTRYVVVETDSTLNEYYGTNPVSVPTGQLLPVNDIVADETDITDIQPFDRYLVGSDGNGYKVVEYDYGTNGSFTKSEFAFNEKFGVRVKSRGLKNYVYVDGHLKTYDDVDCGAF